MKQLKPGDILDGKYRIEEKIGVGPFGAVWAGRSEFLNRQVAIKELLESNAQMGESEYREGVAHFRHEAQLRAQFEHPNIVRVFELLEEEGVLYLVQEFVDGGTVAGLIAEAKKDDQPIPTETSIKLTLELLSALQALHEHPNDIVHRDIKPSTLMLQGKEKRLMLIDFGAAQEGSAMNRTDMGDKAHPGSKYYMSPEQEQTTETLFPTSDIYSVGCILFELLTGKQYKVAQHHEPDATIAELMPGQPAELITITAKALSHQAHERYLSAAKMTEALQAAQVGGSTQSQNVSTLFADKKGMGLGLAGLLIVGLLGALLFNLLKPDGGTQAQNQEDGVAAGFASVTDPTKSPIPQPTSTPFPTVVRTLDTGGEQLMIPAGSFEMGATDGDQDEQPVHTVNLDQFWIDKTEVTNAEYVTFLNDINAATESSVCIGLNCISAQESAGESRITLENDLYNVIEGFETHPIVFVTWKGADEYCRWRGAQLPTEAQWEKAARGLDGRTYPMGRVIDKSLANYGRVFSTGTVEVGSYPAGASPYGVLDMAGNVWEWTADWYDKNYYSDSPDTNPMGSPTGDLRVVRGGSWNDYQNTMRSSGRIRNLPTSGYNSVGFRCVTTSS